MNIHTSKFRSQSTRNYLFSIIIGALFITTACDSTVFDNEIDTVITPVDQVKFLKVSSAFINDSTWTKTPKRDKPLRLLIGGFDGYESAALLRFGKLAALPDTSQIKTIEVQLTANNTVGIQPKSSTILTMYKNTISWNEDGLSERDLNEFISSLGDTIATATVLWRNTDSTSEKFSFDLSKRFDIVQSWKDSSDTNGVLIVGENASSFIISAPSRGSGAVSSSLPGLQFTYQDTDTIKTMSIPATSDGYLLSVTTGLPLSDPDRTYIGGGKAYRGIYKFNSELLANIPETSKISNAEFNIAIDSSRSILPNKNSAVTGLGFTLYFSYLDSSSKSDSTFPTPIGDSTFAKIPIDGNIISINMTNMIQKWVSDNFMNRGLVLWSGSEGSQLFRAALYKNGCDVAADASCIEPELDIFYVTSEGIEE